MKRHPIVTLLLFAIFLLWAYAKDRKTPEEILQEESEEFGNLPWVKEAMIEYQEMMTGEHGEYIRGRIAELEIDVAIKEALERTKDNE